MKIISDTLPLFELKQMAQAIFGNLVKAVVDTDRGLLAVDAELHADLEALLLQNGSRQNNLWGINLYPEESDDQFIEYDSMINVRPSQGNRSRSIENESTRSQIADIVRMRITR